MLDDNGNPIFRRYAYLGLHLAFFVLAHLDYGFMRATTHIYQFKKNRYVELAEVMRHTSNKLRRRRLK